MNVNKYNDVLFFSSNTLDDLDSSRLLPGYSKVIDTTTIVLEIAKDNIVNLK